VTRDGFKGPGTSSDDAFAGKTKRLVRQPFLFLVFDASHPLRGGARFSLAGVDDVIIGRGERRTAERRQDTGKAILVISVDCRAVSHQHARLRRTSLGWMVDDLQSKNGVHINGQHMKRSVALGTMPIG
jgi:pSer/pThr/pTyr-binding forkhead associated (FHA) protein